MNKFEEYGFTKQLMDSITEMGISEPTQIQEQTIPSVMAGKDVIGESATGSGKTLAFGCGIVDKAIPGGGLQALVLAPTRELAEQVKESLRNLSKHKKLRITSIYGGVNINPQMEHLTKAEVVVATPGRLLDHLQRKTADLSKARILVLDEADRMFEMGFIEDVEQIISQCPKQRQTMLFSATMPEEVRRLANRHMNNPMKATAERQVDPSKLRQVYYDVQRNKKLSLLAHLLQNEKSGLVMVFCNTKRTTDFVAKNLRANRINAVAFHGGLTQNKRNKLLGEFTGSGTGVLVCTDVAARGLHIENVSHVYNYEVPKDPKEYVHRIGRTARAGEEGKAINLICDLDYENFSKVVNDHRSFNIEKNETPEMKTVFAIRADSPRRFGHGRPRFGGRSREGYARYNIDEGPRRFGRPGRGSGEGRSGHGEGRRYGNRQGSRPRFRGRRHWQ